MSDTVDIIAATFESVGRRYLSPLKTAYGGTIFDGLCLRFFVSKTKETVTDVITKLTE